MKTINIESLSKDYNSGLRINNDLYIYQGNGDYCMKNVRRLDVLGISIPMKGEYGIEVNGVKHLLHPGEMLVCHTNDLYKDVTFSEDFHGTLIFASLDLISGGVDHLILQQRLSIIRDCPVFEIEEEHFRTIELYNELLARHLSVNSPNLGKVSVLYICRALLADLFETILGETVNNGISGEKSRPQQIFHDFINLLASTPHKPHDIDYYAERLNVRGKYLSAIAKKESGRTAGEWIREYIMNDVRRYLTGTDLSVKEIASRLNFSNFPFFCKSVKRHFGKTPLEIRNENRYCLKKCV